MTSIEYLIDKLNQKEIERLSTILLQDHIDPKSVLDYTYGERARRDTLPNEMFHITKKSNVNNIKSHGLNPYMEGRSEDGVFLTTNWLKLLSSGSINIEPGDVVSVLLVDTSSLKQDLVYDKNYLEDDIYSQNVGDIPLAFSYKGAIEPSLIKELFYFKFE